MKKQIKVWLIVALALILIGGLIFVGVMTVLKWDFRKLSTVKYETNEYIIQEAFENITICTNTANIKILPSGNGECRVVCFEPVKFNHKTHVGGNTLNISKEGKKRWYDYIGVDFNCPTITIYLPETDYSALILKSSTGDVEISENYTFENIDIITSTGSITNYASAKDAVKLKTSTGAISVYDIKTGSLEMTVTTGKVTATDVVCQGDMRVKVSTGDTTLNDITCGNLMTTGDTGDLTMTNVITNGKFDIVRTTGDIKFERCDASELFVKTDTGSVTGTLLCEKVFIVETDTGNINVPKTVTGGKCEISTDTGNINISIP